MIKDEKYVKIVSSPAEKVKTEVNVNNQDITITQNGNYQAEPPYTGFGLVKVDVPAPKYYGIPAANWAMLETAETGTPNFAGLTQIYQGFCNNRFDGAENLIGIANFDTITTIHSTGLGGAFARTKLTGISFANVLRVHSYGLDYTFNECENLTGNVSFPSLVNIQASDECCFQGTFSYTSIQSASFSALTTIAAPQAFVYCFEESLLEDINFESLQSVTGDYAFNAAFVQTSLTNVSFPSLTTITGEGAFSYAFDSANLQSLSFPVLTTVASEDKGIFDSMLENINNCTVHFPAALQATIGNWTSVQNGFGGSGTTVLFDL